MAGIAGIAANKEIANCLKDFVSKNEVQFSSNMELFKKIPRFIQRVMWL
jgi:hypothetical protein